MQRSHGPFRPHGTLAWLLALALALPGAAQAENYLVKDPAQYKKAAKRLQPGDRLVLADGVWHDFKMVFDAHGTAAAPITLMAQTPGKVILSGESNLRIGGEHLIVWGLVFKDGYSPTSEVISFRKGSDAPAEHVRLLETVIDGYNKPDSKARDFWVALYGHDNRIDHSYFAGKTTSGPTLIVRLDAPDAADAHHAIDHNYFGARSEYGENGAETIRIGTSQTAGVKASTQVVRNYFEHCDGEAEAISVKSGDNLVSENTFWETRGSVVLRIGEGSTVTRNVFVGNGVDGTGGIRVIGSGHTVTGNYLEGLRGDKYRAALAVMNGAADAPDNGYHPVRKARIEHNSFIDVARLSFGLGSSDERAVAPADSVFAANLVATDAPKSLRVHADTAGFTFRDNVADRDEYRALDANIVPSLALQRAGNGLQYPAHGDAGAPRDLDPVKRDETGPRWYDKPAQGHGA